MQMTERDKKLIVFLAIFVIIVAGGYWGIYPIISKTISINAEIQEAEALRAENELKVAQLPMLEAESEELEEEIAAARKDFYSEMTSDQVDKYMTGLILDHNLYAYDLAITMPTAEAKLDPYAYSEKANAAAEEETDSTDGTQPDGADEQSGELSSEADWFGDEDIATGVYAVGVTMRVGGERADLQQLIDEFSKENKKVYLDGYNWESERSIRILEDGSYDIGTDQTLTVNLNLYMCEEEEWN